MFWAWVCCVVFLSVGCAREERLWSDETEGNELEETAGTPPEAGRELTPEELAEFTEFVNSRENNGFLLSDYTEPGQVNLGEALYNGAGIEMSPLSKEERRAYEALGYTIETDIFRLTRGQIEEKKKKKMGIGMADVAGGLDWIYLQETDCYVEQHGDTNFTYFTCTQGRQMTDEEYEIYCQADDSYVSDCMLRLRRSKEGYQFLSNQFISDPPMPGLSDGAASRIIEDQSFLVRLNDWGAVRFVSLAPDTLADPRQDVLFELWEDEESVYRLPEVTSDNRRRVDTFSNVEAVSFQDYDKDGYTDIIIICTYRRDGERSAGGTYQEARIYKGAEKSFAYMDDLSLSLNIMKYNKTISQIMAHIEEDEAQEAELLGGNIDILKQLKLFAEAKDEWIYTDYEPYRMGFAIYDLDGDGRLELLTYVTAGTGLFSENHFYRVKKSGDGIQELYQGHYDSSAELDIGMGVLAYQEEETGMNYYLATDVVRNGYAESWRMDGAFYLEGDYVYSMVYRCAYSLLREDDTADESYYDPTGAKISEREWEELGENFLWGKSEQACSLCWQHMYPEELRQASTEDVLEMLAESCGMAGL